MNTWKWDDTAGFFRRNGRVVNMTELEKLLNVAEERVSVTTESFRWVGATAREVHPYYNQIQFGDVYRSGVGDATVVWYVEEIIWKPDRKGIEHIRFVSEYGNRMRKISFDYWDHSMASWEKRVPVVTPTPTKSESKTDPSESDILPIEIGGVYEHKTSGKRYEIVRRFSKGKVEFRRNPTNETYTYDTTLLKHKYWKRVK